MKKFIVVLATIFTLLFSAQAFAGKEIVLKKGGSEIYYAKIEGYTYITLVVFEYYHSNFGDCIGYYKIDPIGKIDFSISKNESTRIVGANISCEPGGINSTPSLIIKPDRY